MAVRFGAVGSYATGIAAPWCRAGAVGAFALSRSAWSLAVIADALANSIERKPVIAIPDYMCNGSLAPLRQNRAKLVFYPIEADSLEPAWTACESLPRFDAFMLVHYFGKPANASRARQLAHAHRARLIEDAAHALSPIGGIGEHGDFVLYSPRKLLPIPDGAFLIVRNPATELMPAIGTALASLGGRRAATFRWRIRRSRFARLLSDKTPKQLTFDSDEASMPVVQAPLMSRLAAKLIATADLAAIGLKRQQNARAVLALVSRLPGLSPLLPLTDDWVPHYLAVRCTSRGPAESYLKRLHRAGLTAETWPDLAPEIKPGSAARHLRETVLLLPCNQFLDPANLKVP